MSRVGDRLVIDGQAYVVASRAIISMGNGKAFTAVGCAPDALPLFAEERAWADVGRAVEAAIRADLTAESAQGPR
jgi:hypothetical protein